MIRKFSFAGALFAALICAVPATAQTVVSQKPNCLIAYAKLEHPLTRIRMLLAEGRPVTIVAIGSSSTAGSGATSAAASYPSRLEALLKARFPRGAIRVINRGIGGEEEPQMLARFERDVMAEKPDLVLWQVASNAVMRDRSLAMEEILLDSGIRRLKSTGADVVLVDLQYTSAVLEKATTEPMLDIIAALGQQNRVSVFQRFGMMKTWHEKQDLPFTAFSIADGLHMNDWGYDCLARNMAAALGESVAPAVAAVHAASLRH